MDLPFVVLRSTSRTLSGSRLLYHNPVTVQQSDSPWLLTGLLREHLVLPQDAGSSLRHRVAILAPVCRDGQTFFALFSTAHMPAHGADINREVNWWSTAVNDPEKTTRWSLLGVAQGPFVDETLVWCKDFCRSPPVQLTVEVVTAHGRPQRYTPGGETQEERLRRSSFCAVGDGAGLLHNTWPGPLPADLKHPFSPRVLATPQTPAPASPAAPPAPAQEADTSPWPQVPTYAALQLLLSSSEGGKLGASKKQKVEAAWRGGPTSSAAQSLNATLKRLLNEGCAVGAAAPTGSTKRRRTEEAHYHRANEEAESRDL